MWLRRKAKQQIEPAKPTAMTVADISQGQIDGRGEPIDYVYFKREQYAIYLSGTQVMVQYADDNALATEQIGAVSALLPLRGHLTNIIRDLPQSGLIANYCAQIAEALRLGLEAQSDTAKTILGDAIQDALEVQARVGRMIYLKWAVCIALIVAFVLITIGGSYVRGRSGVHLLLMATGAGALGALLSIAVAIRNRSVAVAGDWRANAADASVRLLTGIISASVLFLLMSSGMLTNIQIGEAKLSSGELQWQVVLLVGFIAGFLERLVPDLLNAAASGSGSQDKPAGTQAKPINSSSGIVAPDPA
jgi:hypothetical protein